MGTLYGMEWKQLQLQHEMMNSQKTKLNFFKERVRKSIKSKYTINIIDYKPIRHKVLSPAIKAQKVSRQFLSNYDKI